MTSLQVKLEEGSFVSPLIFAAHQELKLREQKTLELQRKWDEFVSTRESEAEAGEHAKLVWQQKMSQVEQSLRAEQQAHLATRQQVIHIVN